MVVQAVSESLFDARVTALGRWYAICPGCGTQWEAGSRSLVVMRARACADLDHKTADRAMSMTALEHCSGDIWAGTRRRLRA
jgi:hypothetical protein